ncbi:glycerophosphodiester phosphodiesterase family protein [Frankia nepalensis]|uniref:glycerophosphodiester phosphodiesterase family protein n=1 Tax=Frankia nepalensis TaxID=1836974 RepID=UPI0019342CFD|nr:glycerophosphodiester phosphodiesterase family protein [Frankia nepalensis]
MARHAYLDHPGPIPFAHRGGAGPWPENSWPAFENAVALGYRYLETDVRATRDGTVMILHDSTLERVADRATRLADLTLAEASRVRLVRPRTPAAAPAAHEAVSPAASPQGPAASPQGSTTSPQGPAAPGGAGGDAGARDDGGWVGSADGEPIPRLDDLLDRWPDLRLNLDVKEPAALAPTLEALRRANALDRVCVTSFDDAVAREARRLAGPGLCVGAGMSAIAVARLRSVLPPWLSVSQRGRRPSWGSRLGGHGSSRTAGVGADGAMPSPGARGLGRAAGDDGAAGDHAAGGAATVVPAQATAAANGHRRPRGLIGRDVVQVPVSFRALPVCDARFVRYMNTVGLPVHVWTVNDEASMSMLLRLGVDGIITDRPELLREVLRRHDLWPAA